MSDAVYPVLPGLTFDVGKQKEFVTLIQRSIGGNETRAGYYTEPITHWKLTYSFLEAADYTTFVNFFNARCGALQSFLFSDPTEDQAVKLSIGAGTGSEEHFQINRMKEGAAYTTNVGMPAPLVYVGGVLRTTNYSIGTDDIITFTSPLPGTGIIVSWSGNLYHRVRFGTDLMDLNSFMYQLWEAQEVDLVSVR